jgi:transcriptional regulator with XRE-family HTH domain
MPNRVSVVNGAAVQGSDAVSTVTDETHYRQLFGRRLREARKAAALTQEQLAARMPAKVSQRDISRWETGRHLPRPEHHLALAEILADGDASYFLRNGETGADLEDEA